MNWETLEELQESTKLRIADPQELYKNLENHIDYNVRYAKQRVELLESVWDEDLYIDCVSGKGFRDQQVKKKSSLSAEDSPMTQHLDKLADYILYSHFDTEEQEKEFEETRELLKEREAIHKQERTKADEKFISNSKDKLRNKPLTLSRKVSETIKREGNISLQQYFESNSTTDIYEDDSPRITYTKVDKELNQKTRIFKNTEVYWMHYAPPTCNEIPHYSGEKEPYGKTAHEVLAQLNEAIQSLEPRRRLLMFFDEMERERLKEIREETNNKSLPKVNEPVADELKSINKLKRELQADYNISADILRKPVVLKSSFISIGETIPTDAWERLSLRRDETYQALLLGYGELKEKYEPKVGTNMWCLLHDFENLIKEVNLTDEERLVVNNIMEDGKTPHKTLQEEIYTELDKEVSISTISNMINKNIPKKIREHYDNILEEWIWTFRRRGEYKQCGKCHQIKLTKHFSADKRNLDGLHSFCKECRANSR